MTRTKKKKKRRRRGRWIVVHSRKGQPSGATTTGSTRTTTRGQGPCFAFWLKDDDGWGGVGCGSVQCTARFLRRSSPNTFFTKKRWVVRVFGWDKASFGLRYLAKKMPMRREQGGDVPKIPPTGTVLYLLILVRSRRMFDSHQIICDANGRYSVMR